MFCKPQGLVGCMLPPRSAWLRKFGPHPSKRFELLLVAALSEHWHRNELASAPAAMGLQAKCSQPIQSAFYKAFYNWGSFVGRKPKLVIFASTVLCVLGAIRLPLAIAFPLESVVEQDQLWVPQEAQAITDKNKYDAAFSTTYRRNVLWPVEGARLVLPPLATPASSGTLHRLLPAPIARDEPLRRSGPNAGG